MKKVNSTLKQLFLILITIIYGCSSSLSSIYDFDFPVTSSTAKSVSYSYQIAIPQGWFAAEDNEEFTTDLWLVNKSYKATIKFKIINLDSLTREKIAANPSKLLDYSKVFVKVGLGAAFKGFENEESFENNGIKFFAYEYIDSYGKRARKVVFNYNGVAVESTAIQINQGSETELFKVQNAVLTSIK